jgi:hypothetical protein
MPAEVPSSVPPQPAEWPVLSLIERRVLGVLVEKAKTTPDVYPLSLNSLVTGCNQKSNRDPVLDLADHEVEEALGALQKKGLVIKVTGGRVERWRHCLYEAWRVDKVELAVLGELLLRGPQTEGELRSRASRMEPIADLDALRIVLKPLTERRLVVYLTAEGRRGTVLTHGMHAPDEVDKLRSRHRSEVEEPRAAAVTAPAADRPPSSLEARLAQMGTEIAQLRDLVAQLQATVASLATQVRDLSQARVNQ